MDKDFRRQLETEAHHLKPLVNIGKDGVNDAIVKTIYEAFNTRELLKVKALDTCPDDRTALGEKLGALAEITLVRNIGKTYILYKKLDEEAPKKAKPKAKSTKKFGHKSTAKWPKKKTGSRSGYGFRAEAAGNPKPAPKPRAGGRGGDGGSETY